MSNSLYDRDFYAWTHEQAALLRSGRLDAADIDNIAEEIESMGRSEKRELVSRLAVLLQHLLKWRFQPDFRSNSWRLTIEEQRNSLADHLDENPSLRAQLDRALETAYRSARLKAAAETGLARDSFPEVCPFTCEQAMSQAFWPE
jgi:hypothetical protein